MDITQYLIIIVSIFAIITSAITILTYFFGYMPKRNPAKVTAALMYFSEGDTPDFSEIRENIVEKSEFGKADASKICLFYHKWGLMMKHGYLPIWVFEGRTGNRIIEIYEKCLEFMNEVGKDYAAGFRFLYDELKKQR